MSNFNRLVRVTYGAFVPGVREPQEATAIEDLRITFKVEKMRGSKGNTAEVSIFNLSQETINAIDRPNDATIMLEAGYFPQGIDAAIGPPQASVDIIAIGQVIDKKKKKGDRQGGGNTQSGPDVATVLEISDGFKALSESTVSESFKAGKKASDVFTQLASGLGITVGEISDLVQDQFANGYSASGLTKDALDVVAKRLGVSWSIQDSELVAVPINGASSEGAVFISPATGLIGSPSKTKAGADLQVQLDPKIRINRLIDLESRFVKGLFRVDKLQHIGDNQQGEYLTKIEATQVGQ